MAAIDVRRYAPGERQIAHRHDHGSVSFVSRGMITEMSGGLRRVAQPGDVVIKPAGTVHADSYGQAGASVYSVSVECDLPGYTWVTGGPLSALFLRAIVEWRTGGEPETIIADLIAAACNDASRPLSRRMKEIAASLTSQTVPVASLARTLGLHPVSLARAFRREHGCSITAYRRRARICSAANLLANTRMPLAELALLAGYSDQSHFCRIFKAETGITPAVFRALAV